MLRGWCSAAIGANRRCPFQAKEWAGKGGRRIYWPLAEVVSKISVVLPTLRVLSLLTLPCRSTVKPTWLVAASSALAVTVTGLGEYLSFSRSVTCTLEPVPLQV